MSYWGGSVSVLPGIKTATPPDVYKEGPYLEHGRIESRICHIYRGEELIFDREKWNGNLTVIEILTSTQKKSDGRSTSKQRLYKWNIPNVQYSHCIQKSHYPNDFRIAAHLLY